MALFPDAPTTRGQRHLRTLIQAQREGIAAGVLFVIQREDARSFHPHDAADPAFGHWLREAAQAGVRVEAYRCLVTPEAMTLELRHPRRAISIKSSPPRRGRARVGVNSCLSNPIAHHPLTTSSPCISD